MKDIKPYAEHRVNHSDSLAGKIKTKPHQTNVGNAQGQWQGDILNFFSFSIAAAQIIHKETILKRKNRLPLGALQVDWQLTSHIQQWKLDTVESYFQPAKRKQLPT